MKISARNQLKGTIETVTEGAVNGVVTIKVGDTLITADITMASIADLGLAPGKEAYAVIKASNVMFATERIAGISARSQLEGTVTKVNEGAVNGHVTIELADGNTISGSITNASIEELGFAVDKPAVAIVKSTDVMVAVD